jgi:hypothetical protein
VPTLSSLYLSHANKELKLWENQGDKQLADSRVLSTKYTKKNKFEDVNSVVMEFINLGHAEQDHSKCTEEALHTPIHVVYKEVSTTTKIRAAFNASAKTASLSMTG